MRDILLVLALLFLAAHLVTDVRLALNLKRLHPRDSLWTGATLVALVGHLILDFVR